MKNILFYSTIMTCLISACSGNDETPKVTTDYPFNVTVHASQEAYTDYPILITATIAKDFSHSSPDDLVYTVAFSSSGGGVLQKGGQTYQENETVPLHEGENSFNYIPTETGSQEIEFRYGNNYGNNVSKTLNINVQQPSFIFSLIGTDQQPYPGLAYEIGLFLENQNNPDGTGFSYSYTMVEGNATIEDNDGNDLLPNHFYNFSTTNVNHLKITPLQIGDISILFTLKSNDGQQLSKTLNWEVNSADFLFQLNNTAYTDIQMNNEYPINLYVEKSENQPEDTDFNFSYLIEQGTAQLKKENSLINENDMLALTPLENTPVSIIPFSAGELRIKFRVIDQFGTSKSQTLNWDVIDTSFSLNTSTNADDIYPEIPIPILVELTTSSTSPMTYTLKIGEVDSNGNWMEIPESTSINTGNYNNYTPYSFPENDTYGLRYVKVEATNNYNIEQSDILMMNLERLAPIVQGFQAKVCENGTPLQQCNPGDYGIIINDFNISYPPELNAGTDPVNQLDFEVTLAGDVASPTTTLYYTYSPNNGSPYFSFCIPQQNFPNFDTGNLTGNTISVRIRYNGSSWSEWKTENINIIPVCQ